MKKLLVAALLLAAPAHAAGDQNRPPSFKQLAVEAEKGSAAAQNNLAVMYATGEGTRQDYTQAAKWYQKAGEQGHAVAQYNLGALYERGLGVPADPVAAKVWYEMAAAQGDAWAQLSLGQLLTKDPAAAAAAYKWLYLASVGDDDEAKALAKSALERVARKLTPAQLAEATAAVRSWRPVRH